MLRATHVPLDEISHDENVLSSKISCLDEFYEWQEGQDHLKPLSEKYIHVNKSRSVWDTSSSFFET